MEAKQEAETEKYDKDETKENWEEKLRNEKGDLFKIREQQMLASFQRFKTSEYEKRMSRGNGIYRFLLLSPFILGSELCLFFSVKFSFSSSSTLFITLLS